MARSVLIVDDEEDIVLALDDLLRDLHDIEVVGARSGEEGLRILGGRSVDAIVSDYKMPGMNGVEFLQAAARLAPGVPRILITAFATPRIAEEAAHSAGVAAVVTKPFHPTYFASVLRVVLGEAA